MKRIGMILLLMFVIGCSSYNDLLKNQVSRYGLDSDAVKILIEKGEPTSYSTDIVRDECSHLRYNQIFTYIKTIPNKNNSASLYRRMEKTSRYYFLDGKFIPMK